MIIRHEKPFCMGLNPLTRESDGKAGLDFGIIRLDEGGVYENAGSVERVFLLVAGEVAFAWEKEERRARRASFLDENPVCLHVPAGVRVTLRAYAGSELVYGAVGNGRSFPAKLYTGEACVAEQFGKDAMDGVALRDVRTVIDDDIAPWSNLVIGEVINYPGKWSSYPPHHHVQPEIYYYRMVPEQGFGFSGQGDCVYRVGDRDAAVIPGGLVHPQTAAPGYAMYYVWIIPHFPSRWLKDRIYEPEHTWMLQEDAVIWPHGGK